MANPTSRCFRVQDPPPLIAPPLIVPIKFLFDRPSGSHGRKALSRGGDGISGGGKHGIRRSEVFGISLGTFFRLRVCASTPLSG